MRAAALMGFEIRVACPKEKDYYPEEDVIEECKKLCEKSGGKVKILQDQAKAVKDVDVVYTDSWMSYGIADNDKKQRIKDLEPFRVTEELLSKAKKHVIFMNCLPAQREMEQTTGVLDGPHSVVFDEAENRIHVQKALLHFLLSPKSSLYRQDRKEGKSKQRIVVALGGNALTKPGSKNTMEEQFEALELTCKQIGQFIEMGHEVIVTHGNGPQVGAVLIQNEEAKKKVPPMPLVICDAETQGSLGYMIQNRLREELVHRGIDKEVLSVVTEIEVNRKDKAFEHPTKPIGSHYQKEEAQKIEKEQGKKLVEEPGKGWRVVVPSPRPLNVLQEKSIKLMVENGLVVICAGGGGIPVVKEDGKFKGVDAVIDKDFSAKCLAVALEADLLLILTDVDCAYLNYKDENKTPLKTLNVNKANELIEKGEFSEGSMLPKIQACVEFVEKTNKHAIITSLGKAVQAVTKEDIGTHITSSSNKKKD
jgi:carbamate kinase